MRMKQVIKKRRKRDRQRKRKREERKKKLSLSQNVNDKDEDINIFLLWWDDKEDKEDNSIYLLFFHCYSYAFTPLVKWW